MTWILLALACAHIDEPVSNEADPIQETPPVQAEEPAEEPAEVPEGPSDEELAQCMTDCIQRNQMRAVAYEIIEADCKASCTGTVEPLGTQPLPASQEEETP